MRQESISQDPKATFENKAKINEHLHETFLALRLHPLSIIFKCLEGSWSRFAMQRHSGEDVRHISSRDAKGHLCGLLQV